MISDEIVERVKELAAGIPCPGCAASKNGRRPKLALSVRQIAKVVHVSHTTVIRIINGQSRGRSRRAPWRCPGCGGKIEIEQCVLCGIDAPEMPRSRPAEARDASVCLV